MGGRDQLHPRTRVADTTGRLQWLPGSIRSTLPGRAHDRKREPSLTSIGASVSIVLITRNAVYDSHAYCRDNCSHDDSVLNLPWRAKHPRPVNNDTAGKEHRGQQANTH